MASLLQQCDAELPTLVLSNPPLRPSEVAEVDAHSRVVRLARLRFAPVRLTEFALPDSWPSIRCALLLSARGSRPMPSWPASEGRVLATTTW